VTTQKKILKNRPVPGRLSNSPVMCKSLKSYDVSFICDRSISNANNKKHVCILTIDHHYHSIIIYCIFIVKDCSMTITKLCLIMAKHLKWQGSICLLFMNAMKIHASLARPSMAHTDMAQNVCVPCSFLNSLCF